MKATVLLFLLCAAAAFIPLRSISTSAPDTCNFPGWSAAPVPSGLTPVTLNKRDLRFAVDFPGHIGAFSDGTGTWIVRWVRTPTRKLHPASDCLRALGYVTQPGPILIASDATRWNTTIARRGAETLCVHERIADGSGGAWTDISAWFWSAMLGPGTGRWCAAGAGNAVLASELTARRPKRSAQNRPDTAVDRVLYPLHADRATFSPWPPALRSDAIR